MANPESKKRKRQYRQRVMCEACRKHYNSDNIENHIRNKHGGQKVKYTLLQEKGQKNYAWKKIHQQRSL